MWERERPRGRGVGEGEAQGEVGGPCVCGWSMCVWVVHVCMGGPCVYGWSMCVYGWSMCVGVRAWACVCVSEGWAGERWEGLGWCAWK